jgi:demethylspheroidene O-methyltransferase
MLAQSWKDKWLAWRNGTVSSPAFQRWAASFWLTKPIAHKNAQDVFDLVAGFVYSQTLVACVELKLLEFLAKGPLTTAELAKLIDLPEPAAVRLLGAAQSLSIVEEAGPARYALGMKGAAILGNGGLRDMIAHHALLYQDLADPVALLRSGGGQGALAKFWPYAAYEKPDQADSDAVASYSTLMAATQPMVADDILHAYPLTAHSRLLDIGGGEGAFAMAAAAQFSQLKVGVFDLPAVAARALQRFEAAGLGHRSMAIGGDFRVDSPPLGSDVISLVRILHDHDDETVLTLLRAIRAIMTPQHVLMVAEPMSGAPKLDPMAEAYFGFYLLAMGRGRARRPDEIAAMLASAGFSRVRSIPTRTPMLVRVMIAQT